MQVVRVGLTLLVVLASVLVVRDVSAHDEGVPQGWGCVGWQVEWMPLYPAYTWTWWGPYWDGYSYIWGWGWVYHSHWSGYGCGFSP